MTEPILPIQQAVRVRAGRYARRLGTVVYYDPALRLYDVLLPETLGRKQCTPSFTRGQLETSAATSTTPC